MKTDYYLEVAYFQDSDTVQEFDELREANKLTDLLNYAEMWDNGDEEYCGVYTTDTPDEYDDLLVQDSCYALSRNFYCGAYTLFLKVSQQEFEEIDSRWDGELSRMLLKNNN